MKTDYKDNQMVLRTEQNADFSRSMLLLNLKFYDALRAGDWDAFVALSDTISGQEMLCYVSDDPEILKLYVASYFSDLIAKVQTDGLPAAEASDLKKNTFDELAKANSIEEFQRISRQTFQALFLSFQRYSLAGYTRPVQLAIEQIHNMKMQPISAGIIAKQLHMDRTHLSKIFHQETGRTMTDYIHGVKMELAAYMISQRTYTIREISDLLGYESSSYFSKLFRKYKGVLPSEWTGYAETGIS